MKSIKSKISKIISKNFEVYEHDFNINYIDHSILDRNQIYEFKIKKKDYIIKISFNYNNWKNELKVQEMLKNFDFTPKAVYKGSEDNYNYIIMKKINGNPSIKQINKLNKDNREKFIYNLGLVLGKIHSYKEFDFYGSWNENGSKSLINYRKEKDFNIVRRIRENSIDDKTVEKGIKILENERKNLKNSRPKLTHKDFSLRNILIDNFGKLTGVLDFEHSVPEDPSMDICSLYHSSIIDSTYDFDVFKSGYEIINKFPYNFINNKKYYLVNTGLYLCGKFYSEKCEIYSRGLKLINKGLIYKDISLTF